MHATIISIKSPQENIRVLRLVPADRMEFLAGQYIHIRFNGFQLRPYSIASAPHLDYLDIHIKSNGGEVGEFIMNSLYTGDVIEIDGPFGDMTYSHVTGQDIQQAAPLILIAGGLGITPIKSIIDTAIARRYAGEVSLYWGTDRIEEQYLAEYFRALESHNDHFSFHGVYGTAIGAYAVKHIGNLDTNSVQNLTQFYLAGPPPMITDTVNRLQEIGAKPHCIHYDSYVPPAQ